MHSCTLMHAYACICMQTKLKCMNAHMRAFMYVATLYAWLCVCMLGRMHTVQPTYTYKGKNIPPSPTSHRGGASPGGPSLWGWGGRLHRIYIYIYIIYTYIHTSSDVLVPAGPRTMKIQDHLSDLQIIKS